MHSCKVLPSLPCFPLVGLVHSVSGEGGNVPSVDDTDAVAVGATAEREENTSAITQDLRMVCDTTL